MHALVEVKMLGFSLQFLLFELLDECLPLLDLLVYFDPLTVDGGL